MASAPPDPHPDSPPIAPETVSDQVPVVPDRGGEDIEQPPEIGV
jgi:hypothetical protein